MPTAPTLGQSVRPEAAPNVRLSPTAPDAAFPGAVRTTPDLSGAVSYFEKAKNDADQVAVSAADAQLVRAKTARLWDPTTGAMNARGKDAIPVSDAAQKGFQDDAASIEDGLTGETQKAAFRRRVAMHYADLGNQLGQHVGTQVKQYDHDTTDSHLSALLDSARSAYQDPKAVDSAIQDTKATLTDYHARNGHGTGQGGVDEFGQQHIAARVSAIHSAVFAQYSNAGQDRPAAAYYEAHKDEMTQADRESVEPIADAGRIRADGQEQSAAIVAKAKTMPEALAAADQIEDEDVRKAVTSRIRQHYGDIATAQLRTRQETYQSASSMLEQNGGNFDAIPLSMRRTMLPGENEALQHRADQIRHPKQFGDDTAYYHALNLAHISDDSRRTFAGENIATGDAYKGLSDQQRSHLLTLQSSVHKALAKDAPDAAPGSPATAPNVAGTPVAPAKPYNPLASITSVGPKPIRKPTPAMLNDVATKGEGYAVYLRGLGYNIPEGATQPPVPAPAPRPQPTPAPTPTPASTPVAPAPVAAPIAAAPAPSAAPIRLAPAVVTASAQNATPPAEVGTPYEKNGHAVIDTPRPDSNGHVPTHRIDQVTNRQPGESWTAYEDRVLGSRSSKGDSAVHSDLGLLSPDVRTAATSMIAAARNDGIALEPKETVRTQGRQEHLFRQGRSTPGDVVTWTLTSDHTPGRAIDFGGGPKVHDWIAKNAAKFGFTTLGDMDPGHVSMPIGSRTAAK